jgi:sulfate/thiosulfate transport system ATP-binding protein
MNTINSHVESNVERHRRTTIQPVMLPHGQRGKSGWNRIWKEAALAISVRHLSKRYGTFQAVDDVSFDVPAGELVALLGPSGSGKSTILRIIAGLETAEAGSVELTGEDATAVPIQRRGVGFVFQHYALFRHMTVRDNIAFGLKVRKLPSAEIRTRVDELLNLVQLTGYATRYPSQLSGGQRQRVALARALAPRPKVLLLDEPFGALDAKVRDELRTWLRRLHDEVHVTSLFVTHDQQEAFEVADQVVVLNRGKIEQMGPPQDLYERPATPFVTGFLGSVNILKGQSASGLAILGDGIQVPTHSGAHDGPISVYVRPHDLELTHERNGRPSWPGRVVRVTPLGAFMRLDVALADGTDVRVELSRDRYAALEPRIGETLFVAPRDLKVFRDPSEQPQPAAS